MKSPKKVSLMAAIATGSLVAAIAPPIAAGAQTTALSCDPGFYQVIRGQFHQFSPGDNNYLALGPDYNNYNAMGYRIADGFVYGIGGKVLYRVDANGIRTDLGELDVVSGAYTGDFGDDGLLHISRGGRDWYKVDVDTMEATAVPELSGNVGVADITNLYGNFYGVSSRGKLYRFDPTALTVTDLGQVDGLMTSSKAYGAAWSTAGGNLYVNRNSGEVYQITGYSTGSPVATRVGSATPTNSNDGASCSLAVTPPGLDDVDGPVPEVAPSTPEAQAAAEEYEENFEVYEATFVEAEVVAEEPAAEEPAAEEPAAEEPAAEPDPVVEEPAVEVAEEATPVETEDAGIGTGAGCPTSTDEDRPTRVTLADLVTVTEDTVPYTADFGAGTGSLSDFTIMSGNWSHENGGLNQLNTCGFDYAAVLNSSPVGTFRWEATFSAISGTNQGGIVFNQSSTTTRAGAMVVDFSEGGEILRWGTYNELGYFKYVASVDVTPPATGEQVTLAVEVDGSRAIIFMNGEAMGEVDVPNVGGYVGIQSSETDVKFHSVTLTARPSAEG